MSERLSSARLRVADLQLRQPANAVSTSFFAGAIGHCASRGPDRNTILACAWQEVAATYPEVKLAQAAGVGVETIIE